VNDLNTISIEGHLTNNPEIKEFGKIRYCHFSIANNRSFKNPKGIVEKETSFFDVEAWDSNIDIAMTFGHKGRGVRIYGRIKQIRYSEEKHGKTIPKQRVVVVPNPNGFEFFPDKSPNFEDKTADVENFYMNNEDDDI